MRRFLRYAAGISATSSRPLLRVALSACCALGLTPALAQTPAPVTSDAISVGSTVGSIAWLSATRASPR